MKKILFATTFLIPTGLLLAAFSMRDPAALALMQPKPPAPPSVPDLPTEGLLVEYIADPIYFNSDYEDTGVTSWAPRTGYLAPALALNSNWGAPIYSATDYSGKPCVDFTDSLLQGAFAYTGQEITWVYVGDFRPDFNTAPDQTGYPRLASLANYGAGHEDFTDPSVGIFLYAPNGTSWDVLRGGDIFSMDGSGNPDAAYRVIMVLKQDSGGHWTQTIYFTDGTTAVNTYDGTVSNYDTDTLNLGGNQEPNLGVFRITRLLLYDHAMAHDEEADAVAYLKAAHW